MSKPIVHKIVLIKSGKIIWIRQVARNGKLLATQVYRCKHCARKTAKRVANQFGCKYEDMT